MTRGLLATIAVLKHALAVVALFWAHIGLAGEGLKENPIATCTCLWEGSFTEIANNADLIMLGAVTERRGNAADFAIEDHLE